MTYYNNNEFELKCLVSSHFFEGKLKLNTYIVNHFIFYDCFQTFIYSNDQNHSENLQDDHSAFAE